MQLSYTTFLDLGGVLLGIAFFIMAVRGAKSLQGSFFKNYYRFITVGALALTLGFLVEPTGDLIGLEEKTIMLLHDLALLVESALLVYASYVLPRDARQYMGSKETPVV